MPFKDRRDFRYRLIGLGVHDLRLTTPIPRLFSRFPSSNAFRGLFFCGDTCYELYVSIQVAVDATCHDPASMISKRGPPSGWALIPCLGPKLACMVIDIHLRNL